MAGYVYPRGTHRASAIWEWRETRIAASYRRPAAAAPRMRLSSRAARRTRAGARASSPPRAHREREQPFRLHSFFRHFTQCIWILHRYLRSGHPLNDFSAAMNHELLDVHFRPEAQVRELRHGAEGAIIECIADVLVTEADVEAPSTDGPMECRGL
mgnify:CR=1 FL=1